MNQLVILIGHCKCSMLWS